MYFSLNVGTENQLYIPQFYLAALLPIVPKTRSAVFLVPITLSFLKEPKKGFPYVKNPACQWKLMAVTLTKWASSIFFVLMLIREDCFPAGYHLHQTHLWDPSPNTGSFVYGLVQKSGILYPNSCCSLSEHISLVFFPPWLYNSRCKGTLHMCNMKSSGLLERENQTFEKATPACWWS